jgi:hypothetical protein
MGHAEMSALAARLRARAESVLWRHQTEQARDLRSAAVLVDELVRLHVGIRRAAENTGDESTERAVGRAVMPSLTVNLPSDKPIALAQFVNGSTARPEPLRFSHGRLRWP